MARRALAQQLPIELTDRTSSYVHHESTTQSSIEATHEHMPPVSAGEAHEADNPYVDGGFGWIVTACSFVLLFQYLGIQYSWGVIQANLLQAGLAPSRSLSVIGAVSTFSMASSCLPSSWLLHRFQPKWIAITGALISSAALALASLSTNNLPGLIFLHGLVFGSSGSLIFMTAYTIPSQYFLKKRGLATGIASCGGGIGGAVWSIGIERLVNSWGLPWAYRFLALLSLIIMVPAALTLRPGYVARTSVTSTTEAEKGIFKSSRYLRALFACFVASYPFFIPPFYISQYSQSVGLSSSQGAIYSALFNIASGIGRIAFGMLADFALGNLNAWMASLGLIVLSSLLIWPFATAAGPIAAFVLICGLGSGGFFSLQSSIVAQIIGSHRVSYGVGCMELAQSLGFLAGPITAGALLDAFGGASQGAAPYRPAMFLVGGTTALSLVLIGSVRFSTNRKVWKRV